MNHEDKRKMAVVCLNEAADIIARAEALLINDIKRKEVVKIRGKINGLIRYLKAHDRPNRTHQPG